MIRLIIAANIQALESHGVFALWSQWSWYIIVVVVVVVIIKPTTFHT